MRSSLTFLLSLVVCLGVAAVAVWSTGGLMSSAWAFMWAALLLIVFTAAAASVDLPASAAFAGLLTGAFVLTNLMIFLDWALGRPATSRLSLGSFLSYLGLYRNFESILGLLAPILITSLSFLVGRQIGKIATRFRR